METLFTGYKKITASGLVRRGRPLTSQTAFGGQLPYEGSLGRPAMNNLERLWAYPTESQPGDVDVMNSRQIIHGLWPCA